MKNSAPSNTNHGQNNYFILDHLGLFAIIIIATLLRVKFFSLTQLRYDELFDTVLGNILILAGEAEEIFGTPLSLYNGKFFTLYNLFSLAIQQITTDQIWIVRSPALIFGILTVAVLYSLTKELYDKKAALVAALLAATLPYYILLSSVGLRIALIPFFFSLSILLLLKSCRSKNVLLRVCAVTVATFSALYIHPSCLILIILFASLEWRNQTNISTHPLINSFAILLASFPYLLQWLRTSAATLQTVKLPSFEYCLFFSGCFFSAKHLFDSAVNLRESLGFMFFDEAVRFPYFPSLTGPIFFNKWLFSLALITLFADIRRKRNESYLLLLWCLSAILSTAFLSKHIEARYLITAITPLIILSARFITHEIFSSSRIFYIKFLPYLLLISTILISFSNLSSYTSKANQTVEQWYFAGHSVDEVARMIRLRDKVEDIVVITDNRISLAPYLVKTIQNSNVKTILAENFFDQFEMYQDHKQMMFSKELKKIYTTPPSHITDEIIWQHKMLISRLLGPKEALYIVAWGSTIQELSKVSSQTLSKFHSLSRLITGLQPLFITHFPNGEEAIIVYRIDKGKLH